MNIVRSAATLVLTAGLSLAGPALAQDRDGTGDRLGRTIEQSLEAEGPWLLPAEQALIERKCGYTPGSRNSDSITMTNGVLLCANGRRVDDPEVRAMVAVASPRISRRVKGVMESPAVRNALAAVSDGAVQRALESLGDIPPRRDRRR